MWSWRVGGGGGRGLVVSESFRQRIHFGFWGGFFYKLTRNPNLTIFFFFRGGGGEGGGLGKGRGEGKCTCMSKCFKWQFYSSRRTPVQNHFEIHACM